MNGFGNFLVQKYLKKHWKNVFFVEKKQFHSAKLRQNAENAKKGLQTEQNIV